MYVRHFSVLLKIQQTFFHYLTWHSITKSRQSSTTNYPHCLTKFGLKRKNKDLSQPKVDITTCERAAKGKKKNTTSKSTITPLCPLCTRIKGKINKIKEKTKTLKGKFIWKSGLMNLHKERNQQKKMFKKKEPVNIVAASNQTKISFEQKKKVKT